jgi:hypothetical protein
MEVSGICLIQCLLTNILLDKAMGAIFKKEKMGNSYL